MPSRFEKFSDRARRTLSLSQEEAQRFNHNYIGTEHILLGLMRETEGGAAKVLANLNVELAKVRSAVEFIIIRGERPTPGEIGLTPRAKKVIELAVDEARQLDNHYIGTAHLLIGIVREGEGVAAGVLESLGVTLEKVRREMGQLPASSRYGSSLGDEPPAPSERMDPNWPTELKDVFESLALARREKDEAIHAQNYETAGFLRDREFRYKQEFDRLYKNWIRSNTPTPAGPRETGRSGSTTILGPLIEMDPNKYGEALKTVDRVLLRVRALISDPKLPVYVTKYLDKILLSDITELQHTFKSVTRNEVDHARLREKAAGLFGAIHGGLKAVVVIGSGGSSVDQAITAIMADVRSLAEACQFTIGERSLDSFD